MDQVVFPSRFRGPAGSANGGYACGVVARLVGGDTVESTLRAPPPCDTPIAVARDGAAVALRLGDKLVAEGKPATLALDVPAPPSYEEAAAAARPGGTARPAPYEHHMLPECFVCGITRTPGDALCLWPGPVGDRQLIAAPWTPSAEVCDERGVVPLEVVWSALDCPTAWIFVFTKQVDSMFLLGRLTAQVLAPLHQGRRYIQVGWPLSVESRKLFGASALFSDDGQLHAVAKGTWIKLG
jgi:hypothetical protein